MSELSACPFCGADEAVLDGKSDDVIVRCEGCGARGEMFYFSGDNDDEIAGAERDAIAAWNRRATPPAQAVGREPVAWIVYAKGGKFTRGIYQNPAPVDFEIWEADGDTAVPLYAAGVSNPQAPQIAEGTVKAGSDGALREPITCEHQWRTGGSFVDCVLCGVESPVWRAPPEPLCNCDTKTPELRFHATRCAYRVYNEANPQAPQVDALEGEKE